MDWIDLRSDTVTEPTPEMRVAMAEAEVGDDVFGDDPTVRKLEAMAAEVMGKEAAVFVASGTMGNLAAVMSHCQRGDEIILGDASHTYLYEAGGVAALAGVHPRPVSNEPDGTISIEHVRGAIRPDDEHFPITRLVVIENTQNSRGGAVIAPSYVDELAKLAQETGLFLHIDGARIFNAAAALGVEAGDLVGPSDSVTFCLSKGLCAPVGSVLCGSGDFIRRARRARKQLGGGMRQAGILAAAGIVALDTMVARLVEDHARAGRLASGLEYIDGIHLEQNPPPSNMIYIRLDESVPFTTDYVIRELASDRIKLAARDSRRMRLVVHYWIDDQAVEKVVSGFQRLVEAA